MAHNNQEEDMQEALAFQDYNNDWHLPQELTFEVFIRLPLKSLAKCKLVSNQWYFLISSISFAKFLVKFSNPKTLIFQTQNCISSLDYNDDDNNDSNKEALTTTLLDHPFPESGKGFYNYCAGSYNGVVCVVITKPDLRERIFLWNPVIRQLRFIPSPRTSANDESSTPTMESCFDKCYWFGFVDVLNDYIIFNLKRNRGYVYSLREERWRESRNSCRVCINPKNMPCRGLGTRFVHIDGVLYCGLGLESIIKFDLVNKTFERMSSSILHGHQYIVDKKTYKIVEASLGVTQENKLCSGRIYNDPESDEWLLEMWVLELDDTISGSWKKLWRIHLGIGTLGPYPWVFGFGHDGRIFVGGKKLVMVDTNGEALFQLQEVETEHTPIYTKSYVETLLSPYWIP